MPRTFIAASTFLSRRGPSHCTRLATRRVRASGTNGPGSGWPRDVSCARQIVACASASPARRRNSSARTVPFSASAHTRYRNAERCSSVQDSSGFIARLRGGLLDPLDDVGRELRHDGERLQVLDDLRRAACAGDHRRHMRILEAPREGHLGERATELFGDWNELFDLGNAGRFEDALGQPFETLDGRARVRGYAAGVLARQHAGSERAPRRRAEADVAIEPRVLLLDA